MPVTETQVRSAVVAKLRENDATARVHRRWRYPSQNRIAEWVNLFRGDDGQINSYQVRRVRRFPTMQGVPKRLIKTEYVYEIKFHFGLIDSEEDSAASEEAAQARIDSLAALMEADVTLGLGRCVTHGGLELPNDFEDVVIGDWAAHRALMRLLVEVSNVNC
jgi:hypothetical protein